MIGVHPLDQPAAADLDVQEVAQLLSERVEQPGEVVERAIGLALLIASIPVLVVCALGIVVLSRRSPLVAHLRVGKNSQTFWMLKLRTMWGAADASHGESRWIEHVVGEPEGNGKELRDPRVTSRFAAFCRRHSIDEIPQFWHVVCGEMSLVGPRPLTRTEIARYYGRQANALLSVKPGLTGLWQVSGRSAINYPRRAELDLELVRELTPKMYAKIVLRTFSALVGGQGAW
jgi:lipopolysaccharide/colanic/teichoic acid biosynthesis glycosyltransferase